MNEERKDASPTIEQLVRFYKRMPVLIYERVRIAQYLRFFKRYQDRLLFVGNLNVLGILLMGVPGYWYLASTKYGPSVHDGLMGIMATAKLDERAYRVIHWCQKKGRLIVYVSKEFGV